MPIFNDRRFELVTPFQPTGDQPAAIEALVEGLDSYDGTLLFVSHDRWFVSNLANRIIEITPQGFRDFQGSYEEYLEKCGDDHLDEAVIMDHGTKAPKK